MHNISESMIEQPDAKLAWQDEEKMKGHHRGETIVVRSPVRQKKENAGLTPKTGIPALVRLVPESWFIDHAQHLGKHDRTTGCEVRVTG